MLRPGNPQFGPFPPGPDSRFGRETGREFPIPDSAGIGNREIPRFPTRPGNGKRGPDWPQIGKSENWKPCGCEYSRHNPRLDVALSPSIAGPGPADGGWRLGRGDGGLWDGLSDDVDPNFNVTRESGIGPPVSRGDFPGPTRIPDWRGRFRESGIGPFPDSAGTGNRGPGGGTGTPARAHRAGGISVASPNASTAKAGPAAWHSAHDHDNLNLPVQ